MKNGIYTDLSNEDYHAEKGHGSSSRMKVALKSIEHYASYEDIEKKTVFEIGKAFEIRLCEPKLFRKKVVVISEEERPDKRYSMSAKANADWMNEKWEKALKENKVCISSSDLLTIESMKKEVENYPEIMKMLKKGTFQYSIFWDDENGLPVKTRPDWVIHLGGMKVINIDIKSTYVETPKDFIWEIRKHNMPFQNVMQVKGLESQGFEVVNSFWLGVSKTKHPFAKLVPFENDQIEIMRGIYSKASKEIKSYLENGLPKKEFSIERIDLTDYFNYLTKEA